MDLYLAWVVINELLTFVQKYGITISRSSCSLQFGFDSIHLENLHFRCISILLTLTTIC